MLYVERVPAISAADTEKSLRTAIASLQTKYPGIGVRNDGDAWVVTVPQKYDVGHEAHFAQVTEQFLAAIRTGQLPAWEVPNMLTKYSTLVQAYQMSHATPPSDLNRTTGGQWQREPNAIGWRERRSDDLETVVRSEGGSQAVLSSVERRRWARAHGGAPRGSSVALRPVVLVEVHQRRELLGRESRDGSSRWRHALEAR